MQTVQSMTVAELTFQLQNAKSVAEVNVITEECGRRIHDALNSLERSNAVLANNLRKLRS